MHLTYLDSDGHKATASTANAGGAGAPEIEVTPAMIAAGCDEMELFDIGDRSSWIVAAVYRAMEGARRSMEGQNE